MDRIATTALPEPALDKAMQLFWKKGFFNTSIDELVQHTGLNRTTIYKHFNGKHGLFVAILKRFKDQVTHQATKPLHDMSRGLSAIKDFFNQFINTENDIIDKYGCLLVATASESPSHDASVTKIINSFIHLLKKLFTNILLYPETRRRLKSTIDIAATVDFLIANVIGLMTLLRSGNDKSIIKNQIVVLSNFIEQMSSTSKSHH